MSELHTAKCVEQNIKKELVYTPYCSFLVLLSFYVCVYSCGDFNAQDHIRRVPVKFRDNCSDCLKESGTMWCVKGAPSFCLCLCKDLHIGFGVHFLEHSGVKIPVCVFKQDAEAMALFCLGEGAKKHNS